jgi:hypothetical protein
MTTEKSHFAVWASDRPDRLEQRMRVRETHRARLLEGATGLRVVLGGPIDGDDGEMGGSLLVIEADDIERVRQFIAGDPYVLADVYDMDSLQIRRWRWGIGRPV